MKVNRLLILAENQFLETDRLILRPVVLADAADMHEYASDEETTRYVFPRHVSLAITRAVIADYFMSKPLGKYAVVLKETGKMIGTTELKHAEQPTAELGYALNKAYWGQGIAAEAASALVALSFDKLGMIRVAALHDVRNPNSGRVMEKIGMTREGILKNYLLHDGQPLDMCLYSITQEGYHKRRVDHNMLREEMNG